MKNDNLKKPDQEKALMLIESFEKGDLVNPGTEIIEGVEQLTTPVIKFEKEGQTLIGLYIGNNECPSSVGGESDYFLFHRLITPNNVEVGFCGSMAIDEALRNKEPFRFIVFIKYSSSKKVKKGNFKQFQIMAIDMSNIKNPLYQVKDHPLVNLYKRYALVTESEDKEKKEGY